MSDHSAPSATERPPLSGAGPGPRFAPLYRQIRDLIVRSLREGQWRPGEPIPSEQELAMRYGVSQGTVRKAIDALAAEHLVVRRQGKGTFVASHHEVRTQFRFLRMRPDEGSTPGGSGFRGERNLPGAVGVAATEGSAAASEPMFSRFLDLRRQRAPAAVAARLGLSPGEPVLLIRRVLEEGVPIVLDEIWLRADRFRGLHAERLASYEGPLYGLFEAEFGTRMIRAEERLKAVAADAARARILGLRVGAALLLVERLSRTYDDVAVELRRGYCNTAHHHYYNELQ